MRALGRRTVVLRAGLGVLALLGALAMAEVGLRIVDYRGSPVDFLRRNDPGGWGADGIAELASDPRRKLLAYDFDLLWRLEPRAGPGVPPEDLLVVALGDGNTWGSLDASDDWPALLQYLADLNETPRRIRVLNAGVPGYSSLQGLRQFKALRSERAGVVVIGFGANDAHRVRVSDAAWAARMEALEPWAWSRLAWALVAPGRGLAWGAEETRRVSLEDFRGHLRELTRLALSKGAPPVLMTQPSRGRAADLSEYNVQTRRLAEEESLALVDVAEALDGEPAIFEDETRLSREGRRRVAELLLRHLKDAGLARTAHVRSPELGLRTAEDGRPEMDTGWLARESTIDGQAGRWTSPDASLSLERRQGEEGLVLDLTCAEGVHGRVDVNGEAVGQVECGGGRVWQRFDISEIEPDRISVRILADARRVLVHGARLVPSGEPLELSGTGGIYAASIDLSEAVDARPELGPGWWPRETWTDGRKGRWTGREAWLHLERRGGEAGLLVDLTLESPEGEAACRIEVNGRPVYAFRSRNGRHRYGIDIAAVPERELAVRLVADRTFVPKEHGRAWDPRRLGIFVHGVWLARSPVP